MDSLIEVAKELRELDAQFVNDRDNVFAKMATAVEVAIVHVYQIDQSLRVPAAEYVPAMQDAFKIIDKMKIVEKKQTKKLLNDICRCRDEFCPMRKKCFRYITRDDIYPSTPSSMSLHVAGDPLNVCPSFIPYGIS